MINKPLNLFKYIYYKLQQPTKLWAQGIEKGDEHRTYTPK